VTRNGDRLSITQGPAAVDVTVVSPPNLSCEVTEKLLKDIKCDSPLEGADRLQQIKLFPVSPAARGSSLVACATGLGFTG
jgi:hypothetical protein